jgi:hypothetical protein
MHLRLPLWHTSDLSQEVFNSDTLKRSWSSLSKAWGLASDQGNVIGWYHLSMINIVDKVQKVVLLGDLSGFLSLVPPITLGLPWTRFDDWYQWRSFLAIMMFGPQEKGENLSVCDKCVLVGLLVPDIQNQRCSITFGHCRGRRSRTFQLDLVVEEKW